MPAKEEIRNRAGQLGVIDRDCRGENKSGHRVTHRVTLLSWPWGSRTDEIKLTLPALGVSCPVRLKYHLLMEGEERSQAAVASDPRPASADFRQGGGRSFTFETSLSLLLFGERINTPHGRGQKGSLCHHSVCAIQVTDDISYKDVCPMHLRVCLLLYMCIHHARTCGDQTFMLGVFLDHFLLHLFSRKYISGSY